jgi:tRNA modification GTPase
MSCALPLPDSRPAALTPAVTLLTPPGRGALAVVGVVGEGAVPLIDRLFRPRSGRPLTERPEGSLCFGRWLPGGGASGDSAPGEDLVVVKRRADLVEVHCHGGLAASTAVIASLVGAESAREVPWTDWLRLAGATPIEVEAHAALARAGGPRAAQILSRQLAGGLDDAFAQLTACEAAGDHATAEALRARLRRAARVGLRLDRPWRVVLAGPVNAGKSSLVNALAGHARSLVSSEPGTTRDLVETRLVLGGWEVDLVDTAGLRDAPVPDGSGPAIGAIEQEGIARALAAQTDADLVLRIIAADTDPTFAVAAASPSDLLVLTKCDLPAAAVCSPDAFPRAVIRTSAVTGVGIDLLADRIVAALVPEERSDPTLLDGAVPFTPRQLAAL